MMVVYWVLGLVIGLIGLQVVLALIYQKLLKPPLWKRNWGQAFLTDCTARLNSGENEIEAVTKELESIRPTLGGLGEILYQEGIRSVATPTSRGQLIALVSKIIQTKIALETRMPKDAFADMCIKINREYDHEVQRLLK